MLHLKMEILETPQPVQPTESKSTDWTKIILAAVLGFVLLASSAYAGYWYGTQQVQQPEKPAPVVSQPTPKPTPTPEPTTTPVVEDETENWETYTNTVLSVSFRYPHKISEVIECETGSVFIVPLDRNFDPCQSSGGRFYITAEEAGFSLPDWYYRDYDIKTESVSIGSKSATKYSGTISSEEPAPIPPSLYIIAVPMDTKTVLVNVEDYPGAKTLDNDLVEQILSTFKFLD